MPPLREVIHEIFKPKCVVCFSVPDCFDRLDSKFHFAGVEKIIPEFDDKTHYVSTKAVKRGLWSPQNKQDTILVLGSLLPSQAISNDDWGAIATWMKAEMQAL